jgi:hypothetical protein
MPERHDEHDDVKSSGYSVERVRRTLSDNLCKVNGFDTHPASWLMISPGSPRWLAYPDMKRIFNPGCYLYYIHVNVTLDDIIDICQLYLLNTARNSSAQK